MLWENDTHQVPPLLQNPELLQNQVWMALPQEDHA